MRGAAIAASAAALGGAVEAQAQGPECADFYTLDRSREISTELHHAVSQMENAGFDTRVHMYYKDDLKAVPGIRTQEDAANYLAAVESGCGVEDNDTVSVFFFEGARLAYVRTGGAAHDAIPDSLISAETPEFRQDLRDTESSYQKDIADMLNRLNPNLRNQANDDGLITPNAGNQDQVADVDMPWKEVGISAGAIALAALLGGRLYRGVSIRNINKKQQENSELLIGDLGETIRTMEEAIAGLPHDDAPELRVAYDRASDTGVELDDALDALASAYRDERSRIWPNRPRLEDLANAATEARQSGSLADREAKEEFRKFEEQLMTLRQRSSQFDNLLSRNVIELSKLTDEGWDVTIYTKINEDEFRKIRDGIVGLVDSGYVDRPSDLLDKYEKPFQEFVSKVASLEIRRAAADDLAEDMNDKREELASLVTKHHGILQGLRDEYNYDCYKDIHGFGLDADSILAKMDEIETAAKKELGVKSAASVEALEAYLDQYQSNLAAVEHNCTTIAERKARLEEIREELPQRIEHLDEQFQQVHGFVTELEYPHDVEEDTREMLATLTSGFSDLKQNDLVEEKPNYLALDDNLNSQVRMLEIVKNDVRQQKQEMESLRASLSTLQRNARTDVAKLTNYLNRNRSTLSGSGYYATGLRAPEIDLQAKRGDLKVQIEEMRRFRREIDQQSNTARSYVNRQRNKATSNYGAIGASSVGIISMSDGGGGGNFGGGDGGGGTSF